MKKVLKKIGGLGLLTSLMLAGQSQATTLSVPYYAQQSNEWCWNASSEMVLNTPLSASYPGTLYSQTTIAAYGSEGQNVPNYLYGSQARATNSGVVSPALNGVDHVLKHFGGLSSRGFAGTLSASDLQKEIDAGRPVVARIGWCTNSTGAFVNNGGGHIIVLYGFDGTTVDINDPWPDNGPIIQTYSTFSDANGNRYTAGNARFKWTHTLTLGASLDVVFLIDTTGSMSGAIGSVKSAAVDITSNIFALFPDARIAVKDFKDMPTPLYGDGDSAYLDEIDSSFSTNRSAVGNAVAPLSANGGGDTPEALYSSLLYTINNTSWSGGNLGGWRTNPTPRIIIVATDAPGHDPVEPWSGGHSLNDVIAAATVQGREITIYGLVAGGGAQADLDALALGTGGATLSTGYGGVAGGILDVINQTASSTRHPQGTVNSSKPKFNFDFNQIGMANTPTGYVIQIQKSNSVSGAWGLYVEQSLKVNSFTPSSPLPQGNYRWRLGAQQGASRIVSPAGDLLTTIPSGIVYENEFTEFSRIASVPGAATFISPSQTFTKTPKFLGGKTTFTFGAGINATSYRITLQQQSSSGWKTFKTLTVQPPSSNPSAATLSFTVVLKPGVYRWSIVSQNSDYPTGAIL